MPEWIHTFTVDASYDDASQVTGIGVVIQERVGSSGRGPILARLSEGHVGVAPGKGEMFAVLRALEIAMDRGFTRIKIRSDYNAMRRDLRNRHRARDSAEDDLQHKVLHLASRFVWIDFVTCRDEKITLHTYLLERVVSLPDLPRTNLVLFLRARRIIGVRRPLGSALLTQNVRAQSEITLSEIRGDNGQQVKNVLARAR
jgi:hypothetical protein